MKVIKKKYKLCKCLANKVYCTIIVDVNYSICHFSLAEKWCKSDKASRIDQNTSPKNRLT